MKLYDVPRNTKIRIIEATDAPPAGITCNKGDIIEFGHIDGMYSFCRNSAGEIVHLQAWTEVEIVL